MFKVTGDITVDGEWSGEEMKLLGQLTVRGGVRGRIVNVTGNLEARDYVEAEQLKIKGAITIDGLINAEHADIRLYGPCRVKEIGGRRIDIRRSSWMSVKNWIKSQMHTELNVSVIEGDDIYLEYTKADVVRGNRIHIGKGCVIGRVEYRQSLHVASSAKTGVEVQL
jgi:cytoskeletal protein CcmA (bactofilin family)